MSRRWFGFLLVAIAVSAIGLRLAPRPSPAHEALGNAPLTPAPSGQAAPTVVALTAASGSGEGLALLAQRDGVTRLAVVASLPVLQPGYVYGLWLTPRGGKAQRLGTLAEREVGRFSFETEVAPPPGATLGVILQVAGSSTINDPVVLSGIIPGRLVPGTGTPVPSS